MHARLDRGAVHLLTRTGLNWTHKYPRRVDELGELRPDPLRQSGRGGAPARYRPRQSLFLTLPTRALTGQQIMSSEG